ncbi:uncharacterized protein LOC112520426 [Cynara cardunculus var. scolymus]|uniref:Sec20 n=1 Tax=Cynara cardunculus var. scolymus TaxID=59895 RepID=A0A103Y0M4_CYNCS|nr:uncharacterized protein LOC112520426 [Cynara cardunculus var. scolymus]KVI00357.1 Sec20 [Cynara cardunculus var. scolymus]
MEVKPSDSDIVVIEEFNRTKKDWDDAYVHTLNHIRAIQDYNNHINNNNNNNGDSLARLNGLAQDGLGMLTTALFNLDLLAPQLPRYHNAHLLLHSWNNQIQSLRSSLRKANLQAKASMRKATREERELLLGGGEESTARRLKLQTKAGMTSAAGIITESLRRTRQLMIQEVERSGSTLMAFEESKEVLKKAEREYKGHHSLPMRTRKLLLTMKRQDVLGRIILLVGFVLFSLAVLYVVSKRIGILKLQRKVIGAIRARMVGEAEIDKGTPGVADAINHLAQINEHAVPNADVGLEQHMHDEL